MNPWEKTLDSRLGFARTSESQERFQLKVQSVVAKIWDTRTEYETVLVTSLRSVITGLAKECSKNKENRKG